MKTCVRLAFALSLLLVSCAKNDIILEGLDSGSATDTGSKRDGGTCQPSCQNRDCGLDGCGGLCGTCGGGLGCNQATGKCICVPKCDGKACGKDGCGGICGTCATGKVCNGRTGVCADTCAPACTSRVCGDDGCSGSCGTCTGGKGCDDATGQCTCTPRCTAGTCGDDGCGGTCPCASGTRCDTASQTCLACKPACQGRQCGDDSCAGSCGTCPGEGLCTSGQCSTCGTACSGKECGSFSGCSCGICGDGTACDSATGKCVCAPACQGKQCGPDACGGECGTCPGGGICSSDGRCSTCASSCAGKDCGTVNGCTCGTCGDGQACDAASGKCVCSAQCQGKQCGPDGCGDTCGTCAGTCSSDGQCSTCTSCAGRDCGTVSGCTCGSCKAGFACDDPSGKCVCEPACQGRQCGPDGCGGSCGSCAGTCSPDGQCSTCTTACAGRDCGTVSGCNCGSCKTGFACDDPSGKCQCQAQCKGKQCGPDGCGSTCGSCPSPGTCDNATGQCVCQGSCSGKECGDDGCGKSCGDCKPGTGCGPTGKCDCLPKCGAKVCGPDGCSGVCGTCGPDKTCDNATGQCVCKPDCAGRTCGPDGCGGTCGSCPLEGSGQICTAGQCVSYCGSDLDCYEPDLQRCLVATHTCVQCLQPTDCVAPLTCGPDDTCVGCAQDADCTAGTAHQCDLTAKKCVECLKDQDCPVGTCTAAHTCLPPNDNCSAPSPLSFVGGVATVASDNTYGNNDTASNGCAGVWGNDLVWTFTTTARKILTVEVVPTGAKTLDPIISIRSACGDPSTELTCFQAQNPGDTATFYVPTLSPGTYFIWVDGLIDATYPGPGSVGTHGPFTLTVKLDDPPPPPPNDSCTGTPTQLNFVNDLAKVADDTGFASDDTRGSCNGAIGPDVVYTFSIDTDRSVTVKAVPDPSTPGYEPIVYLRTACADPASELGCSQTDSGIGYAQRVFPTLPKGTYYVWVDSPSPVGGKFALFVTLGTPTTPLNDVCKQAAVLDFSTGNTVTVDGSTTNAYDDTTGSCQYFYSAADLVWTFTTTSAKHLSATVTGIGLYEPAIFVRTVCDQSSTDLACNDAGGGSASVDIGSLPAGTYYLWVDGSSSSYNDKGDFNLSVTLDPADPSAVNDTCLTPLALSFTNGVATVQGKTGYASDSGSGSCQKNVSGPDLVYTFSTTTAQSVSIGLLPNVPSYQPAFYLRQSCASGPDILCAEAASLGSSASQVLSSLPPGSYYLWVDGANATSGDFTLGVTVGPVIGPPANDTCAGAEKLSPKVSVQGHTLYANDDYGSGPFSAICSAGAQLTLPGPDVVYVYTPTLSGPFTVTVTPELTFDVALWYTSNVCGGSGLDCADFVDAKGPGGVESLTVSGVGGVTYYFIVDSASSATSGNFGISVQ